MSAAAFLQLADRPTEKGERGGATHDIGGFAGVHIHALTPGVKRQKVRNERIDGSTVNLTIHFCAVLLSKRNEKDMSWRRSFFHLPAATPSLSLSSSSLSPLSPSFPIFCRKNAGVGAVELTTGCESGGFAALYFKYTHCLQFSLFDRETKGNVYKLFPLPVFPHLPPRSAKAFPLLSACCPLSLISPNGERRRERPFAFPREGERAQTFPPPTTMQMPTARPTDVHTHIQSKLQTGGNRSGGCLATMQT